MEIIQDYDDNIETLKANIDYCQENISECQSSIVQVEEAKVSGHILLLHCGFSLILCAF